MKYCLVAGIRTGFAPEKHIKHPLLILAMDNQGELEIRVNKHWIERAFFLIIIIGLVVFFVLKGSADTSDLQTSVTNLTTQVSDKTSQILQLETKVAELQKNLTKINTTVAKPEIKITTPVVNTTKAAPVAPVLSGKLVFTWDADTDTLTQAEYNADAIKPLAEEYNVLSEQYNHSDSTTEKTAIREEMNVIKADIAALKVGDPRLKLNNVTVTIDNGIDKQTSLDYELCWLSIECTNVKSTGSFNVDPAKKQTYTIDLKIPTMITIDKTHQLQLIIWDGDNQLFKDRKTFSD